MLIAHDNSGRQNWVTKIKNILFRNGFGFVWEAQGIGDLQLFVKEFKDRLIDIHRQEWQAYLNDNSKEYLEYQPSIVRANYTKFLDCRQMRRALCLLKTDNLPLNAIARYGESISNPICAACDAGDVEDIVHFMFVCTAYDIFRKKYIPRFYCSFPSTIKLAMLIRKFQTSRRLKC